MGVHFRVGVPHLHGCPCHLIGGLRINGRGGGTVRDVLDRVRAGEEGMQNFSDTGQARRAATDPCPLLRNRPLWEGAGIRSIVGEKLVEGVGDLVLAPPVGRGYPF